MGTSLSIETITLSLLAAEESTYSIAMSCCKGTYFLGNGGTKRGQN